MLKSVRHANTSPQWTEFLSCPVCYNVFNETHYRPISLACGHTVCKSCLLKFQQRKCPFDQSVITRNIDDLPANFALLQLVSATATPDVKKGCVPEECKKYYELSKSCVEELALLLKPVSSTTTGSIISVPTSSQGPQSGPTCVLSRPMQRKLITLVNCQLVEDEGRARALRAARSLGERTVTELILQHQNPQQLSSNLWAAVRGRGCQFLGPGMQEEVLKLILLALEDGSALSRKVLVLFVVQRLEAQYPQASKTAIGHVVQLLYRASCFKVTKRDEESSLMQLKEEYRSYDTLRREHDSQIVQIAMEAGLRIAPDQWSSLLYGDSTHKSHMQSIIDKLQTPQTFSQSVSELLIALERTSDPHNLQRLRPELEFLASIDPSPDVPTPSWENLDGVMKAVKTVVEGLVYFLQNSGIRKHDFLTPFNARYKTSMCRDFQDRGHCPRASNCTFAHSEEELEKHRQRNKRASKGLMPHRVEYDDDDDEPSFASRPRPLADRPDLLMDMNNVQVPGQKKGPYTSLLMSMNPAQRAHAPAPYNRATQPPLGAMPTIPPSPETMPMQHGVLQAPAGSSRVAGGGHHSSAMAHQGPSADLIATPQGLVQTPAGLTMTPTQVPPPQQPPQPPPPSQVPRFVQAQTQSPNDIAQPAVPQQNQVVVDPATAIAMQVNADSAILQAGSIIPQQGQVFVQPPNTIVAPGQVPVQQAAPQAMQVQNPQVVQGVMGVNHDGQQAIQPGMQPAPGMMNPYMTPYGPAGAGMMGPRFPMHHPMMYPYPPMPPYMPYYHPHQGFYPPPDNQRMPYDKYYTSLNPFAEPWNPSYGAQYPDPYRSYGDENCAMCNQKQAEQRQQQQKQQQLHHGHSRMCQHAGEMKQSYGQPPVEVSYEKTGMSPSQKPKEQQYQQQQQQYQQQQGKVYSSEGGDNDEPSYKPNTNMSQPLQQPRPSYQSTQQQQPQSTAAQSTSQQQHLKQYTQYSNQDVNYLSSQSKAYQQNQPQEHHYNTHSIKKQNTQNDQNSPNSSQYRSDHQYQQQKHVDTSAESSYALNQQYLNQQSDSGWQKIQEEAENYAYKFEADATRQPSQVSHVPDDNSDYALQTCYSQLEQQYEHTSTQKRVSDKERPLLPMFNEPNAQLHRQSLDNLKERREVILAKLQEIGKENAPVTKIETHVEDLPPLFKYVQMDVKESGAYKNTLKHPSPMDTGPPSLKDQLPSKGEIFERLGAISGFPPRSVNDSIMTSWATSTLNSSSRPKNSSEWPTESEQNVTVDSRRYDAQRAESQSKVSKNGISVLSKEKNSEWKCDENNFPYWKDVTENLDSPISTPPTTPQPVNTINSNRSNSSSASFSDTNRVKNASLFSSTPQMTSDTIPKMTNPLYNSSAVMTSSTPMYNSPHSAYDSEYMYSKSSYTTKEEDFSSSVNQSWSYGLDEASNNPSRSYRSYTSEYCPVSKVATSVYNSLADYSVPSEYNRMSNEATSVYNSLAEYSALSSNWTSTTSTSTTGYHASLFGSITSHGEDHIPFVEGSPTISKFGPISRTTRATNKADPVEATADEMSKTAPVTAVTPLNGPPLPSSQTVPSRFSKGGSSLKGFSGTGEPAGGIEQQEAFKVYSLWTNEVNFLEMKAKEANTEDEKLCVKLQAVEMQISMKEQLLVQAQTAGRLQARSSEYMKKRQQEGHCNADQREEEKDYQVSNTH